MHEAGPGSMSAHCVGLALQGARGTKGKAVQATAKSATTIKSAPGMIRERYGHFSMCFPLEQLTLTLQ